MPRLRQREISPPPHPNTFTCVATSTGMRYMAHLVGVDGIHDVRGSVGLRGHGGLRAFVVVAVDLDVVVIAERVLLQFLDRLFDSVDSVQTMVPATHDHGRRAKALPQGLLQATHLALHAPALAGILRTRHNNEFSML